MGRQSAEYREMLFDPHWDERTAYWMEPRPGRKLSHVDIVKRELAEAQRAAIMKDRAAFEIESGMYDDAYITSMMETICVPTPEEAASQEAELSERLLLIADHEGPEAVADLHRARPDLF